MKESLNKTFFETTKIYNMKKIEVSPWVILIALILAACALWWNAGVIMKKHEKEGLIRGVAIADSLKKVEEHKDSIQYERKMAELRDLREAYKSGFKEGRKVGDEIRDSYLQGYREGLTNFHQELTSLKSELEYYKNSDRRQTSNENSNEYSNNLESVEEPLPMLPQSLDFSDHKAVVDSSYTTNDYAYNQIYANTGELFFGFETDFAFGVPFNNSPSYDTWNYLVLNYMSENWGDKESTSISFGCSGKSRQIRLAKYLYTGKFRMSVMDKLIWDPVAPTVSIVSVGVDYKLKNSPVSVYGELGCKFLKGASPFVGFGARINLQKKIWKIK